MIDLKTLIGKKIKLIDTDNHIWEGLVGDYVYPEDNPPENVEGIVMDYPKKDGDRMTEIYEIDAPDIQSVEVIL